MRSITRITIFALAAAAVAMPAVAASDYFLHLGDVTGGSAAKAGGAADNVGLDYAKLRESPSRPSQK